MRKFSLLLMLLGLVMSAQAQKPAMDHSVYDSWKNLNAISVPRNGDILMYTIAPQEGDVDLIIENIRTGKKIVVPRATKATLNQDGSKVVAVIKPMFSQTRDAKIKKTKKDDMPKDSLAIIDVKTGKVDKFANYKSHATASKWTSFVAFELTPAKEKPAKKDDAKDDKKPATPKKDNKALIVMNVQTAQVDTIKNVSSYKFNEEGNLLAYVVEPEKKDSLGKAGLYLYNTANGEKKEVLTGEKGSKFKTPSFSKTNTLAFYANTDTTKAGKKNISIYLYDINAGKVQLPLQSSNSLSSTSGHGTRITCKPYSCST